MLRSSCVRTWLTAARAGGSGEHLDVRHRVFLDEFGAHTKLARLYGRAFRGQRVVDRVPHGHWKTMTFVGALRVGGFTAPTVVDGPMNGDVFLGYVQQQLTSTLREGDIVVMDNLAAHKVAGVREAIETVGRNSSICHRTARTSIRSNSHSQNSKHSSAPPPNEPLKDFKPASANCSITFNPTNAETTSDTVGIRHTDLKNALVCTINFATSLMRWRFSLHTLLIATTLVAVVLGLIAAVLTTGRIRTIASGTMTDGTIQTK